MYHQPYTELVQRFEYKNKSAVVRCDPVDEDYLVQFYANGIWMDASDYSTDDREEALEFASSAIHDEREWCEANNLSGN